MSTRPAPRRVALAADHGHHQLTPEVVTALAMSAGGASLERVATNTAIDAGGLAPDLAPTNSWIPRVDQIDPIELLEVQLCNATAPFILISRLRAAMAAAPARRKYVVNVSAMEGQFSRGYKGPGHPHTNMAKAALNMLTRTSAKEMLETDGILMTAVDTGWITDERPYPLKARLAGEGFHAPLDWSTGRPGYTTRSCAARPARTCTAASSRTSSPRRGSCQLWATQSGWMLTKSPTLSVPTVSPRTAASSWRLSALRAWRESLAG